PVPWPHCLPPWSTPPTPLLLCQSDPLAIKRTIFRHASLVKAQTPLSCGPVCWSWATCRPGHGGARAIPRVAPAWPHLSLYARTHAASLCHRFSALWSVGLGARAEKRSPRVIVSLALTGVGLPRGWAKTSQTAHVASQHKEVHPVSSVGEMLAALARLRYYTATMLRHCPLGRRRCSCGLLPKHRRVTLRCQRFLCIFLRSLTRRRAAQNTPETTQ